MMVKPKTLSVGHMGSLCVAAALVAMPFGCTAFQGQSVHTISERPLPENGRVELRELEISRPTTRQAYLELVWAEDGDHRVFRSPIPKSIDVRALRLALDVEAQRAWAIHDKEIVFSVDVAAGREWEYGEAQPQWAKVTLNGE